MIHINSIQANRITANSTPINHIGVYRKMVDQSNFMPSDGIVIKTSDDKVFTTSDKHESKYQSSEMELILNKIELY